MQIKETSTQEQNKRTDHLFGLTFATLSDSIERLFGMFRRLYEYKLFMLV